ncbi:MAG: DUF4338 domain-containing protein [Verrucomicrobiae bacterium]|nr:DUF4338 domain-containing protein [Verrucomicrobiae bacterium]
MHPQVVGDGAALPGRYGDNLGVVIAEQQIQGRWIRAEEILELQNWIGEHPDWSRKRVARELCAHWEWRDARGRLKDFAARSFLLKLEAQGVLDLPALRIYQRRPPRRPPDLPGWQAPAPWSAPLRKVQPVSVEVIEPGGALARRWAFYLHTYHYLGLREVGENLGYLVRDALGRDLACLPFSAPAWRCAPRERALGWSDAERRSGLHTLANNTRFLILPWVRVPHLAGHVLGVVARRIGADWHAKYGHGLDGLETFVEQDRFAGTCYRAANWQCVGRTQGRSRQDRHHTCAVPRKDIYLYRLRRRSR